MNFKIVAAEDEAPIRRLIHQSLEELEDEGVAILFADNGVDALALIEREHPQLILLDVMMPQMNGFDVCHAIRTRLNRPAVYVVMLTAKGQEADQRRSVELGANVHIVKPFHPDQLLAIARQVMATTA